MHWSNQWIMTMENRWNTFRLKSIVSEAYTRTPHITNSSQAVSVCLSYKCYFCSLLNYEKVGYFEIEPIYRNDDNHLVICGAFHVSTCRFAFHSIKSKSIFWTGPKRIDHKWTQSLVQNRIPTPSLWNDPKPCNEQQKCKAKKTKHMLAIIWQFWNIMERWISTSLGTSVESFATNNIGFIVYHASQRIQCEWKEKFNRCSRSPPIFESLFYVNGAPIGFFFSLGKQRKSSKFIVDILEKLGSLMQYAIVGPQQTMAYAMALNVFFPSDFNQDLEMRPLFLCANQVTLATRINDPL